ncbi:MAG: Hsp70 family protein [Gammaproteobacteria bacterium]|nr:Hsp70 family protein [Gammaproteobacteria bacterium]
MNETIIGIDLGTTNSEVAVARDGRVEVLEISNGSRLLPSMVGLADDGALLVGEAAWNQYRFYPERTVRSIKRRMGSDEKVVLGGQDYTPQEISALILKRLKAVAESHLGESVRKAVITVPAYFSDAQRQSTRDAGEIAGLEVPRIINEPTAAALAYESSSSGPKRILVYDLGGGTFDVSVVRLENDVVEVLASHGNNHLGGDDFDQKIVDHVLDHLKQEQDLDISASSQAMARILRAAESAKISLSDNPYAMLEEEYLMGQGGVPVHLSLELARDDYEAMIRPFVDETLQAAHTALEGAGIRVSQLDEILLVGGATRTPLIARHLESELGLRPRSDVDPELCVAAGAAIQAGVIAGGPTSSVLVDVTPYTFGTSALAEFKGEIYPYCYVPLIRRNSVIPTSKSEVFYTACDGQTTVEVMVYQGEDPDALNNTEIGRFLIEGLSDVPSGNPVITTFSLDLNGILHVTAKEKETGLARSITIDNAIARFEAAQMKQAVDRIGQLFEGKGMVEEERAQNRDYTQARALIEKAERLMDGAGEDDREDLVDLVEGLTDAMTSHDSAALQTASDELTDLIFYLES